MKTKINFLQKYFLFASKHYLLTSLFIGGLIAFIIHSGQMSSPQDYNSQQFFMTTGIITLVHLIIVGIVNKIYITQMPDYYAGMSNFYAYALIEPGEDPIIVKSAIWGKKKVVIIWKSPDKNDTYQLETWLSYKNNYLSIKFPVTIICTLSEHKSEVIKALVENTQPNTSGNHKEYNVDNYIIQVFQKNQEMKKINLFLSQHLQKMANMSSNERDDYMLQENLNNLEEALQIPEIPKVASDFKFVLEKPTVKEI